MALSELENRVAEIEHKVLMAASRINGSADQSIETSESARIGAIAEEISRLGSQLRAAEADLKRAQIAAKASERMAIAARIQRSVSSWCTENGDLVREAALLDIDGIEVRFRQSTEGSPLVSVLPVMQDPHAASSTSVGSAHATKQLPNRSRGVAPRVQRVGRSRGDDTLAILWDQDVIREGTALVVDPDRLPEDARPQDSAYRANVGPLGPHGRLLVWEADGQDHSVSELAEILRDRYGVRVNSNKANGNKYWCLADDPKVTLWEISERWRR